MLSILSSREHRPFAMPQTPWVMQQTWGKLLFAHWTVPIEQVRALVPNPETIELDTFGGQAYVGVVPFAMTNVRPRSALKVVIGRLGRSSRRKKAV